MESQPVMKMGNKASEPQKTNTDHLGESKCVKKRGEGRVTEKEGEILRGRGLEKEKREERGREREMEGGEKKRKEERLRPFSKKTELELGRREVDGAD